MQATFRPVSRDEEASSDATTRSKPEHVAKPLQEHLLRTVEAFRLPDQQPTGHAEVGQEAHTAEVEHC